jgi:riboflavin-specific deaminase-like protein
MGASAASGAQPREATRDAAAVRRLIPPDAAEVDLEDPYPGARRDPLPERPWVLVNMVTTVDGATAVDGVSGQLGGEVDRAVFGSLRRAADVVLAGAGTVRAEDYGQARPRPDGTPGPRIAVVTRSGDLDPDAKLFRGAQRPIVFTCAACPAERVEALRAVAEVAVVGDELVDLAAALAELHGQGVRVVTCEGGPQLNGQLIELDLVDEWCVTVDPSLAGGLAKRSSLGGEEPPEGPHRLRLDGLLEADGVLLARYVRDRD